MRAVTPLVCAVAVLAPITVGCGGGDESTADPETTAEPSADGAAPQPEEPADDVSSDRPEEDRVGDGDREEPEDRGPAISPAERAAIAAVRDYVAALDARDVQAVCAGLAPGAIDDVELPRNRSGCANSLRASLGYRDPRGLPVWESSRMVGVGGFEVADDSARVVATVRTRFADRDEPSVEDDIVHLTRGGDRWLVAKPSATLYRAVGIADIPPSVLAPPG